jgi:intein/homing endonuclease
MKSLLPPDSSLSIHSYELFLGHVERHFFHLLFCVNEWRESLVLPFWIREGSQDIHREFIGGFFTAFNYCYVTPDDFTPCVFSLKSSRMDEWMRCLQEMNSMVNALCPMWTMGCDSECIVWTPPQNILHVVNVLGVRFRPSLHKTLSLGVVYHTVPHVWNSFDTMRRCVDPYGAHSQLLFLPLQNIRAVSKEITMDFTTSSSYHSFVANGFVTHNSAGIVKNMSLSTQVSVRVDTSYIRMIIEELPGLILLQQSSIVFSLDSSQSYYKVFLNGNWIGMCQEENSVYSTLCTYKNQNRFPPCVSVSMCDYDREIHVYTDEGRLLRPLWDVRRRPTREELEKKDVSYFLKEKKIVFLDSYEIENKVIAMTWDEVDKNGFYDFCEIHPSLLSGLCVSIIPYAEHTQAPRVTYYASMGKQAIGYYATTHPIRTDTISHLLWYPEKPLIRTHYGLYTKCDTMATGNNLIVAICTYTGFNQEDSVIFNQSAIDRGLFRSYSFRTLIIEERKKSTNYTECIQMPSESIRVKSFNYSKLHDDGIIKVGVFVGSGDVIVGRVQIKNVKSGVDEESDTSVIIKTGEEGFVDTVFVTKSPDGYKIVKIKIRTIKVPEIGDKVASRSAQKGTIGMVFRHEDMPFTIQGIVPDIIINPLCIPSRMTINQLIECLGAKSAAHKSIYRFSTAFSSHSTNVMDHLCQELRSIGFEPHGNECMMNGFTGEMFESTIFIGPTYYHRLKHLVSAKIHARNHGSLQVLTRQPLEGRSRDGGLRFGEMERDSCCGRTPIPLSCGLSIKIEDMYENGWEVLGWCPKADGIVHCRQIEFLEKRELHECVEVYFQDGRKLECTLNHPLLTSDNKWILAKDLLVNDTRVKTSVNYPLCDISFEMNECKGWSLQVSTFTLSGDTRDTFLRSLAFMRLLGILVTDGHITKKRNAGTIFLGHEIDVYNVVSDLRLVFELDDVHTSFNDGTYMVHLPSGVIRFFKEIDGVMIGNKTRQKSSLPTFLCNRENNIPVPFIREFLGGLFGGDGHTCYLGMHRGKRDILTSISFSKSSIKAHIDSLYSYMNDVKYLLNRCGIHDLSFQNPKQTTNSKSKIDLSDTERTFSITLHLSIEELIPFYEKIGFRYCVHKSTRLEASVSYKRFRNEVTRQHNWLVERVIEITKYRELKSLHPTKKIQTKKAIDQALKELLQKEPLYHEYAIPTGHDISDHVLKGTAFGKFRSNDFPTAHDFMIEIGAVDWFLSESAKQISYGVKRGDTCLPTMNLKVVFVKPIGPQKVFDIQVERTESFLANGVVAHNCMISHGVSRFLTERLFDMSDKFSVPVCSNCGIFPNVLDHCNGCQMTIVRRTPLPYACKLLFQELMAMGIKITLSPCEDIP